MTWYNNFCYNIKNFKPVFYLLLLFNIVFVLKSYLISLKCDLMFYTTNINFIFHWFSIVTVISSHFVFCFHIYIQLIVMFFSLKMKICIFYRWFLGFDWDGLRSRSIKPPILPKVIIDFQKQFYQKKLIFLYFTVHFTTKKSFRSMVQWTLAISTTTRPTTKFHRTNFLAGTKDFDWLIDFIIVYEAIDKWFNYRFSTCPMLIGQICLCFSGLCSFGWLLRKWTDDVMPWIIYLIRAVKCCIKVNDYFSRFFFF